MAKKTYIHVHQAVIRRNQKTGGHEPVITCKSYNDNRYGHEAIIYDKDGNEVARVVYRPEKPLPCGARVWIETHNRVEVINDYGADGSEGKGPVDVCGGGVYRDQPEGTGEKRGIGDAPVEPAH